MRDFEHISLLKYVTCVIFRHYRGRTSNKSILYYRHPILPISTLQTFQFKDAKYTANRTSQLGNCSQSDNLLPVRVA